MARVVALAYPANVVEASTADQSAAALELRAIFSRLEMGRRNAAALRETFGKYIDPRGVEGIIDRPAIAHGEGQRRTSLVPAASASAPLGAAA